MGSDEDIDRWQYRVVTLGTFETKGRLGPTLARHGSEGWELVTVYDKASNWFVGFEKGFMLFKRHVPPGEPPKGEWAEVWSWEDSPPSAPQIVGLPVD